MSRKENMADKCVQAVTEFSSMFLAGSVQRDVLQRAIVRIREATDEETQRAVSKQRQVKTTAVLTLVSATVLLSLGSVVYLFCCQYPELIVPLTRLGGCLLVVSLLLTASVVLALVVTKE